MASPRGDMSSPVPLPCGAYSPTNAGGSVARATAANAGAPASSGPMERTDSAMSSLAGDAARGGVGRGAFKIGRVGTAGKPGRLGAPPSRGGRLAPDDRDALHDALAVRHQPGPI